MLYSHLFRFPLAGCSIYIPWNRQADTLCFRPVEDLLAQEGRVSNESDGSSRAQLRRRFESLINQVIVESHIFQGAYACLKVLENSLVKYCFVCLIQRATVANMKDP